LGKYEAFVEPEGIETARQAEERLVEKLKQFTETVKTVEKEIEKGSFRSDHVNVAGNTALKFLKSGATESKNMYTLYMLIRSNYVGSLYCFLILDGHNSDSNDFRICSCHSSK
jgi:Asp-tRNA(Asn)/Glu-tRNA(Gln) amidotransferase B subunit